MPHRIDIDGVSRKMFLLRSMALASRPFCRRYRINRATDDQGPLGWGYYLSWLKSSVSGLLLETAINLRVVEDFLRQEEFGSINFDSLLQKVSCRLNVARLLPECNSIPLRECLNKIMHAREVMLDWVDIDDDGRPYEFWNGDVMLFGRKGSEEWTCEVSVVELTEAVDQLLWLLAQHVDWYHVYKHDE